MIIIKDQIDGNIMVLYMVQVYRSIYKALAATNANTILFTTNILMRNRQNTVRKSLIIGTLLVCS